MADSGRTAEGRKVSDWPKIFGLKIIIKSTIMDNQIEWNSLFSAENIWFEIYRRPSADAVGGCKYGHFYQMIYLR